MQTTNKLTQRGSSAQESQTLLVCKAGPQLQRTRPLTEAPEPNQRPFALSTGRCHIARKGPLRSPPHLCYVAALPAAPEPAAIPLQLLVGGESRSTAQGRARPCGLGNGRQCGEIQTGSETPLGEGKNRFSLSYLYLFRRAKNISSLSNSTSCTVAGANLV